MDKFFWFLIGRLKNLLLKNEKIDRSLVLGVTRTDF